MNEKLQTCVVCIRLMTNIGTFAFGQRFPVNEISWTERSWLFFRVRIAPIAGRGKIEPSEIEPSQRGPLQ
jgi:hypothetical protein